MSADKELVEVNLGKITKAQARAMHAFMVDAIGEVDITDGGYDAADCRAMILIENKLADAAGVAAVYLPEMADEWADNGGEDEGE